MIADASRKFKPQEKNYPTYYVELAVVIFTLKIRRYYINGLKYKVFTNYYSLQHAFTHKDFNIRQRRWMELLKDHDMTI